MVVPVNAVAVFDHSRALDTGFGATSKSDRSKLRLSWNSLLARGASLPYSYTHPVSGQAPRRYIETPKLASSGVRVRFVL